MEQTQITLINTDWSDDFRLMIEGLSITGQYAFENRYYKIGQIEFDLIKVRCLNVLEARVSMAFCFWQEIR